MVECARDFMLLVDFITFLLGCAILAVSIYAVVAYNYFQNLITFNTIYISMAVGGVLILVACFGCVASRRGHKGMLCIYLFVVTAALAAQIAATVLIANFAGALGNQSALISSSLTNQADILLNNAVYSSYTACCTGCPSAQNCTNIQPYYNQTLGNCFNSNTSTFICGLVPTCSDSDPNQQACFKNPGTSIPPVSIDQGICTTFQSLKNGTNVPLVGSALTGSCGGGSPLQYMHDFVAYFNSVFYYFIIAFGVLCGIQALNLLAACFILFCTNDRSK